MAYRGRGRGRGRYFGYAKQGPFELFPDADLPDIKNVTVETNLVRRIWKFDRYWKVSPYYLEETISKSEHKMQEVERFSDRNKPKNTVTRDSLLQTLVVQNFPLELNAGMKGLRGQCSRKKARWNPDIGMQKMFEMFELKEGEAEKKKHDDDDEEEEEEEEELSDDYNQNIDFDDDEDDYNMEDDGDDEPTYSGKNVFLLLSRLVMQVLQIFGANSVSMPIHYFSVFNSAYLV